MNITGLIEVLLDIKGRVGDIEVCAQSHGCCQWPHDINDVIVWSDPHSDYYEPLVMIKV